LGLFVVCKGLYNLLWLRARNNMTISQRHPIRDVIMVRTHVSMGM
jgi:hypothetical protein